MSESAPRLLRFDGPTLLDAALGTRLIARGLDLRDDDPALWNQAHPEAVAALHRADVAAGANALLTNTFGANRSWLARFGAGARADVAALNRAGAALARDAAGPDRLVFGSIGPTAIGAAGALEEQAGLLVDAGVDGIFLETYRADEAAEALDRLDRIVGVPILVSLVAWPEPLAATARRLIDGGASALGGNCQADMEIAVSLAEALRAVTDLPLIVKPGGGLPGAPPVSPGAFAEAVPRLLRLGPALVGGCCGTTEAHLAALRDAGYHQGTDVPFWKRERP